MPEHVTSTDSEYSFQGSLACMCLQYKLAALSHGGCRCGCGDGDRSDDVGSEWSSTKAPALGTSSLLREGH